MRVLPLENEAVNECWISDKDRFSLRGARTRDERLTAPMIKQGGEWKRGRLADGARVRRARARRDVVATARRRARSARSCRRTRRSRRWRSPARLVRGLGSDNIDFRLRQSDFRGDGHARRLSVARHADRRSRRARSRAGRRQLPAQGPSAARAAAAPGGARRRAGLDAAFGRRRLADPRRAQGDRRAVAAAAGARRDRRRRGAGRRQAGAARRSRASSPSPRRRRSPRACCPASARRSCSATTREQHPDASQLLALAQALAEITGATLGCLTEAANSVGRLRRRRAAADRGRA